MKLGIVMDPINSINVSKDTGFAMLLEAQKRGWTIDYMEMDNIFLDKGIPKGDAKILHVEDDPKEWYRFIAQHEIELSNLDVILIRKDPPFDSEYLTATLILELAEISGVLVVNKPQSLRDCNEKLYTLWFPELIPFSLVTRQSAKIKQFAKQHKDIIIKPLHAMGGSSVFRVKEDDPNLSVIIETVTQKEKVYAMAQEFIPEISKGDKRILLVDGEAVSYCLARIPAKGETRANLAVGGIGVVRELEENDLFIARCVGPTLRDKGLLFVGLDVIGNRLTEINVTSPTCVRQIETGSKIDIMGKLFDAIERRVKQKRGGV